MPANSGEEAAMLLNAYQQAALRDANRRIETRRRALRTVLGVSAAAALIVGCVVAVDLAVLNDNAVDTTALSTRADAVDQPVAMESQFGWSSLGSGWCSLRSSTWCMFSKDTKSCEESMGCNNANSTSVQTNNGAASEHHDQNATKVEDDTGTG
ncbi:hypothetical protein PHYBOEH_008258 [Phytophthora boehmeriae]|uniref:Uncharacterized protein n=1 Tax=Phytophthora boehmeriae TaxID=109152 RepID=A0A8T1W1S4_9STRA|nr:hypothetical protein PHYBOEH_008258 [Phytophthora boehmeriae]